MAILKGPLEYSFEGFPSDLKLEFDLPVFRYRELDLTQEREPLVQREIISRRKKELTVQEPHYSMDIADDEIMEEIDLPRRVRYLSTLFSSGDSMTRVNLDDLSFVVPVTVYHHEVAGGQQELEVIDLVSASRANQAIAGTASVREDTARYESFFVNKRAYDKLVDILNIGAFSNALLLPIFTSARKQSTDSTYAIVPDEFLEALSNNLTEVFNRVVEGQREEYLDALPQLIERLKDFDFSTLFSFPITIPKAEAGITTAGGTFIIETNEPKSVTLDDLVFYDLSLSYTSGRAPKSVRYHWDPNTQVTGNQPIPFSFEVQAFVQGPLMVEVKAVDGSTVWQQEYEASSADINDIKIRVPLVRPNVLRATPRRIPDRDKKLRGQVIQADQCYCLGELTVLIQVKNSNDTLWRIRGAATTDRNGNFSIPYPYGNYQEAQALLSVVPDKPTNIRILPDQDNETISDEFLYLLLSESELPVVDESEEDCDCHSPKKAKRLPDQRDLIESDEYTQDIGTGCVNLTTPNRTLREYEHQAIVRISDPDVANYTLRKITDIRGNSQYNLTGARTTIKRQVINFGNPVRWQDSPDSASNLSFYQAVTVATGHILHYKSVFKADGYSLGDLLYSLPLAPGQKKQIVVLDSAHSLTGAESQTLTQGESLSASLTNDRAITDQLSGTIGESLSGRSQANTSGVSAGLGLAGSAGAFGGSLGVSGGYAKSGSSASQNSSRDISQFFGERLRQSIMQNASSYRQLNATVVTTVREGQQYAVTTESVANHNHCHALTMMYFEVLRHYAIFQELAYVEECVFVPLLMTNFSAENISKWKDILAVHLLATPSSTYFQPFDALRRSFRHPLLKAFDANERIKTGYANVEFPVGRYADERMNEVSGQMRIRVHIPRPKTRFDRILSFPVIKKTITSQGNVDVAGTIRQNIKDTVIGAVVPCAAKGPSIKRDTVTTEVLTREAIFDIYMTLDANYETVPPARCIRVHFDNIDVFESPLGIVFQGDQTPTPMDFFAGMEKEKALWSAYATILGMSLSELFKYFGNNVIADWDKIFTDSIAPMIMEKLVNESTINILPLGGLDITSLEKYPGGERVMTYNLQTTTSLTRAEVEKIKINFASPLSGTQKDVFFNFVTFNLVSISLNYTTNFSHGTLIKRSFGNDLRDGVPELPTLLNHEEKRNPRHEDILLVRELLEHLNSHLEHYNKMLWFNLDPDRRFMLLDGFNIQIFNDFGLPVGYRSLASVVKNQLITITGNSLVFPVAAGYRVSQSYVMERPANEEAPVQVTLLDHYKPFTPTPPYRISVPTRGVFLEAIPGECDACEKVKPNSSQDWNKFGVEEPTAINAVTPPTPTITDWKAAFKDFAAPLVSIQNAPDTPAPGAGLAGLAEILGKAGVFTDVTGLQGNQQNAIKTYLSNQENVKAMAGMAQSLAMQQHNTQNAQSIADSIAQAGQAGTITPEEQSNLTRQHLQQQIDGGERLREEARAQRELDRPSLTEAAVEAADSGRTVTAQRTDTDGNLESVEISADSEDDEGEGKGINIRHKVARLLQPSSMLCWATAATMMVNWKKTSKSSIPEVLKEAGKALDPPDETRYTTFFDNNQGLLSSQKPEFIAALNMVGEPPASYPLSQYALWLQTYGPLWITTDAASAEGIFSPHARILTRIKGPNLEDTSRVKFTFNDPGTGTSITQTFKEFISAFEQMVTDNTEELFIQVVHFKSPIASGEGQSASSRSWMQHVPGDMAAFKGQVVQKAQDEYAYWHNGGSHTGDAWWEDDADPHVVDRLTAYWRASFNTNAQGAATGQLTVTKATANIANQASWSAAFISSVISGAGITDNDVFSHSIRHVDFVARAIKNKEQHVFGNPFWAYRVSEYAPQLGDIVARSSQVTYNNVVSRSNWRVRRAESHSDVVVAVNQDHIIVIGGNLELDSIQTAKSGSAWTNSIPPAQQHNVSVGKRKIYLTEDHKIDPTKTWEIFDNTSGSFESRVQYTGPQSDYFAIIKVRTNVMAS